MAAISKTSPNQSQKISVIGTGSVAGTSQAKSVKDKKVALAKSAKSVGSSGSDKSQRDTWKNHFEYIFACIGFSVGYGNIWRYPYLAYENGGGR